MINYSDCSSYSDEDSSYHPPSINSSLHSDYDMRYFLWYVQYIDVMLIHIFVAASFPSDLYLSLMLEVDSPNFQSGEIMI